MQTEKAKPPTVSSNIAQSNQKAARRSVIAQILSGQIDGNFDDLIAAISGPFQPIVSSVFSFEYQPLYILTETSRRQVWHACFAAEGSNGTCSPDAQRDAELRRDLLRLSNRELLEKAFGTVPNGFERALGKLGLAAQNKSCYLSLHRLLSSEPSYRHALSHQKKIDERMLDVVAALGPTFSLPNIATLFRRPGQAFAVSNILQSFVGHGLIDDKDLISRLKRVRKMSEINALVDRIYCTIDFQEPPIPASDMCRPIDSVEDLEQVARRFNNCLTTYTPEVIRGEMYFYEWLGDEPAVIQLRAERPFGWLVDEIKAPDNCDVSVASYQEIRVYFQKAGAFKRPTIESVIRWSLRAGHDARRGPVYARENHDLAELLTEFEREA